jgi:hypothetical protein
MHLLIYDWLTGFGLHIFTMRGLSALHLGAHYDAETLTMGLAVK